jgi:hypothetical protein
MLPGPRLVDNTYQAKTGGSAITQPTFTPKATISTINVWSRSYRAEGSAPPAAFAH